MNLKNSPQSVTVLKMATSQWMMPRATSKKEKKEGNLFRNETKPQFIDTGDSLLAIQAAVVWALSRLAPWCSCSNSSALWRLTSVKSILSKFFFCGAVRPQKP